MTAPYTSSEAHKLDIYNTAVNAIASAITPNSPRLYAANGAIVPDSQYTYRRTASGSKGSMKNWVPTRLMDKTRELYDRQKIVERSVDLTNNDPHAAGIVDTFAATVVGSGLTPIPSLDNDDLQFTKDEIRALQARQRSIYYKWHTFADAGQRMNFGAIQYLAERSLMEFGEYVILAHMIADPVRPYSLALQALNPLRLRTPIDKMSDHAIKDGVELGEYGEPVAYWIKKSSAQTGGAYLGDSSDNFLRVPARTGHRQNVFHFFISQEPEQVRGWPFFGPAMKFFRDLNDYLDAELVSNIVTSAFALFIKVSQGQDPFGIANNLGSFSESRTTEDGSNKDTRYQEFLPGQILYGNMGEEAEPIAANRPGQTFEPFTRTIKKAIAMSLNIPYPVLFKDVEGVNFAGFRSAMLDAWRVFMMRRSWLGHMLCQPVYTMLQEEAYLKGDLVVKDFYLNSAALTKCDWRGSPKGDIEPIKAVQADTLAIQNNIKTRAEAIAERGGNIVSVFDQLEEEQQMMKERGLTEEPIGFSGKPAANLINPDGSIVADTTSGESTTDTTDQADTDDGAIDDEEGAGNEGM
jgi:lambda family phage portal protein